MLSVLEDAEAAAEVAVMTVAAVKAFPATRFRVADWMAYALGLETREAWRAWARGLGNPEPDNARTAATLPPMLRRRISKVGQMAFRASYALSEQRTARLVFCSRHGELDRTLRVLRSLIASEQMSPTDFTLSVHNALAGLLSIIWGNTAGHTAIAAGADSFAYGLMEAVASLQAESGAPVMLVYFDDLVPPPYDEIADSVDNCLALALLLEPPRDDGDDLMFAFESHASAPVQLSASAQALDFLSFMLSGERERSFVGERAQWRWRRCA
ncbi:MAG TPA: beta-ketoacyl synthase chain length factor [Candidatus Binataceae bacterium]|nr:beta-ketoacyl synthase chain length factor [Candidatus Binataceae bacterium]